MKRRSPPFVILVSLFTLGLYTVYWLYATRIELIAEHIKIPAMSVVLYPFGAIAVALLATLIASLILPNESMLLGSIDLTVFPVLVILFSLAVLPLAIWWFWRYCGGVAEFTYGRLSQGEAFALFWLLAIVGAGWVWPGVVQGYLNTESFRRVESHRP